MKQILALLAIVGLLALCAAAFVRIPLGRHPGCSRARDADHRAILHREHPIVFIIANCLRRPRQLHIHLC